MPSSNARKRPEKAKLTPSSSRLKAWVRKPLKPKTPLAIPIIEVFAAFVALDRKVDPSESEVALDFLRNAFPEADHYWLSHRLEKALNSPKAPTSLIADITYLLDADYYPQLALQLYVLIDASSNKETGLKVFHEFFDALGQKALGDLVHHELSEGYEGTETLPFTRLICSTSEHAEIILPASNDNYAFRLYQSGEVIIIRNTGGQALWLSGVNLPPGHKVRMRSHQRIILPNWTLNFTDLNFFLNYEKTKQPRAIFLHEADSGLVAERVRTRLSSVRIDFGTTAKVHGIRNNGIQAKGIFISESKPIELQLHDSITLSNGSVVTLEDIRQKAIVAGGRFKLSPGKQTCIVSNDPLAIGKGDLLISPNLAGKITIRISYDPITSIGELEIIESERTLLINNHPVKSGAQIADGALIRLSASQAIRCRFSEGIIDEERTVIQELHLDGISHRFNKNSTALDSINFKVMRGEMLCIMGPSGCGKSTLLATIAGHLKPDRGHVRFNGISLYQHRSRLAPFITMMPQEEALNPHLTVREHLIHASAIRRPHLDISEHERRTESILAELALSPLAERKVGSAGDKTISGGERGRLNLGLDLGSAAEIFLFDEPISGLSSKDSEHVTETLRALARDKIVLASLHRPGASVLALFDKVLLLDKGGKVAYFGSPSGMNRYFAQASNELHIPNHHRHQGGNQNADFVFDVLETPLLSTIGTHESQSFTRRFPPSFWQERHENHRLIQKVAVGNEEVQTQLGDMPRADDNMPIPVPRPRRIRDQFILFITHLKRAAVAKVRNKGTFYSTILEAPLLSLLIALTLRASAEGSYEFSTGLHIVTYLFLAVTVAMFLGLTNSATEILRDMPVLRRERNTRYGTGLYIAAKFTTLSLLAIIQCAIFVSLGHFMLEIKEMWLSHWLWTSLTAMTGTAMALLISTIVKSERAALSSIPLLLVPQLLLAGALVPFGEMNRGLFIGGDAARNDGAEPVPAIFMPLRYSFEGIILSQATENPFERERRNIQKEIERLKQKPMSNDDSSDASPLSGFEAERIKILTAGLTRLYAAEATNQDDAAILAHAIARASLYGSMRELEAINIYQGAEDETKPVQSFFQNTRAELLVRRAEMHRVDMHAAQDRSIFLAEWKFWFNQKLPSLFWCKLVLAMISIICVIMATAIMTRWNRRTN
ncbi:ATP-binding cassette domain-containing protein [Rubritalea marina]|uniref:ATP-binding cassette domain-containing protein n=1 Tax=Rubritalea marina TaxID=361055 RepID=UPI00037A93F8|nr:ATP-binding cassette domain-containing protein [Rubritalea marina]